MRIIYVTMKWPTRTETFCARDINALTSLGHEVQVIALRPYFSDYSKLSKDLNIEHIRSYVPTVVTYFKSLLLALKKPLDLLNILSICLQEKRGEILKTIFFIPLYFWAMTIIKQQKPDIVHLFWGHYPAGIGILLGRQKTPYRFTMFQGAYDLVKKLHISFECSKYAERIFTHAHANIQQLSDLHYPTHKISVVHRGIALNEIDSIPSLPKSYRDICFIGRLIESKGVHLVIQSMPLILRHSPNTMLHIIGDGPERMKCETLCKQLNLESHVTFYGFLPPKEVYSRLYRTGFLILPSISKSERLPNVVKEAMYAGAIPILSRTDGIDELVQHNKTGILLDTLSPQSISSALLSLLEDAEQMESMSKIGKDIIRSHFDVQASMTSYIKEWEKIISEKKA